MQKKIHQNFSDGWYFLIENLLMHVVQNFILPGKTLNPEMAESNMQYQNNSLLSSFVGDFSNQTIFFPIYRTSDVNKQSQNAFPFPVDHVKRMVRQMFMFRPRTQVAVKDFVAALQFYSSVDKNISSEFINYWFNIVNSLLFREEPCGND